MADKKNRNQNQNSQKNNQYQNQNNQNDAMKDSIDMLNNNQIDEVTKSAPKKKSRDAEENN